MDWTFIASIQEMLSTMDGIHNENGSVEENTILTPSALMRKLID